MPLIQHNSLPSIDRIQQEGGQVCSERDINAELARLNIAFLNMMPDKALSATERQFLRLLAGSKKKNCYIYPFTIDGVERSVEAKKHVENYYSSFKELKSLPIDALVITGANVAKAELTSELFWPELAQTLLWAKQNVRSTVCSCLATHAACKVFYELDRKHLGPKCWGVFEHEVVNPEHSMTQGVESKILMCHSRFNDIAKKELEENSVRVLIESDTAGVQLAIDESLNMVYMQGHPEYDDISLLKEYKREIVRFANGEIDRYPQMPENYFNENAQALISNFQTSMLASDNALDTLAMFPEAALREQVTNQWQEAANTIFINWLDAI